MATTPISEITTTIQLVKTMSVTLSGLVEVVEKLTDRVERLEADRGHETRPHHRP